MSVFWGSFWACFFSACIWPPNKKARIPRCKCISSSERPGGGIGAAAHWIRRASANWRWRDKPTCPKSPNLLFPHGNSGGAPYPPPCPQKTCLFWDLPRNALFEEKGAEWEGLGTPKDPQKSLKSSEISKKVLPGGVWDPTLEIS